MSNQIVELIKEQAPATQFDPPANTLLKGATSAATAVAVTDYPYGRRLRCVMRYWLETKNGNGTRVVSQTNNPKKTGLFWNKPKASTYTVGIVVLRTDEKGHVKRPTFSLYDVSTGSVEKCNLTLQSLDVFVNRYGDAFSDNDFAIAQLVKDQIAVRLIELQTPHPKTPVGTTCPVCKNYESTFATSGNCTGTAPDVAPEVVIAEPATETLHAVRPVEGLDASSPVGV